MWIMHTYLDINFEMWLAFYYWQISFQ